jgi:signal peptidase II
MSPKLRWFLAVAPLLFGFDFWSKKAVVDHLGPSDEVVLVPGWLSFVHSENPDAAFSVAVPHALLFGGAVVAFVVLMHTLWTLDRGARLQAVAIASLVAGAAGNAIDRIADGTVTDFIRVHAGAPALRQWLVERFGTATWPIFNVADTLLFVGIGLFLVSAFLQRDDPDLEPA